MADLLECLIQTRALGETAKQLAALVSGVSRFPAREVSPRDLHAVLDLVEEMADAEHLFGTKVRLILSAELPVLPSEAQGKGRGGRGVTAALVQVALERFAARREENLELLARCRASDLSRSGLHPQRGEVSVADLVALALAHDTERLGRFRQHLMRAVDDAPTGGGS